MLEEGEKMNKADRILKQKLTRLWGNAIDDETIEACRDLEFYDKHGHFPPKKRVGRKPRLNNKRKSDASKS